MKRGRIILLGGILIFAVGCSQDRAVDIELFQAAALMETQPDSALILIRTIDRDVISHRSTEAKYALLYSQALDKNYEDTDDDSLMRIAYRYYNKRMCSDSLRFLLNYHYGRIYQNGDDFQEAIRYYLTAEKYALTARKNYFLGLVYTRVGEVYSDQMNYHGMLEYYQKAYKAWKKLHNPVFGNSAILNIANAYLSLGDTDNAVKYYTTAMELAKANGDDDTIAACLSNLGTIYVNEGDYSKAQQAVKEIERTFPDDLSIQEYTILAKAYYLQHKIDSARYYFNLASELADDVRDEALLVYLSLQIETAAGNYKNAVASINEFIQLSDSISRMVVSQSATAAEGKFYKEQTAFASYRLKVRTFMEFGFGGLICVVAACLIYYYRQRMKRKQEQIDRYMSAVDNIRVSKDRIIEQLADKEGQLKELVLSRFDILDQLGRAFYERDNTKAQQEVIYKQVKTFFTDLTSKTTTRKELEEIVNTVNDNIIIKLREQLPKIKSSDIDLLIFVYAGFSAQIISVIINDSVSNIYTRKSRLKTRIATSDAPDKELFLQKIP